MSECTFIGGNEPCEVCPRLISCLYMCGLLQVELQYNSIGGVMFSVRQKREIADKIQEILRATQHPELPDSEIQFLLHVDGARNWSWADIRNNGAVTNPGINPHNEAMDK